MGIKRSAGSTDTVLLRCRAQPPKKAKLSPSAEASSNSSEPSSGSVSEDSALQSSPAVSRHAQHSSISSIESLKDEDEDSESLSESTSDSEEDSSSEEDEDDEVGDDENDIVTIGGPKKPSIVLRGAQKSKMKDLHGRLQSMLLQLARANQGLGDDAAAFNMENVDEDEAHIEMNLGLGVLEEVPVEGSSSEDDSSSDEDIEPSDEEDNATSAPRMPCRKESKPDAMSKLLGRDSDGQKADIQVLG